MEYLMTYGWAILIIAVVLAALFELGVFNPMTFAPKASPGSCQVVRPEGAGTTNFISLEGECNGELPQYVAQFNGQNSYISTGVNQFPVSNAQRSLVAWIYLDGSPGGCGGYPILTYGTAGTHEEAVIFDICPPTDVYFSGWGDDFNSGLTVPLKGWYFVGYTYQSASNVTLYLDQQQIKGSIASSLNTILPTTDPSDIGKQSNGDPQGVFFYGLISNVQLYNTSLTENDIQALYQEGIGGAPIKIQSLVGWWPLNGNANDYSGNGNNGAPSGVTYTSNWYSGYSAP
jgi:hypothetical protein